MLPRETRNENGERGATLLEFALISPLLLLIIFGVLDLGFAIYAQNTMSLATREGARVGIVNPDTNAIKQRVVDKAFALSLGEVHVCYNTTGFCSTDTGTRNPPSVMAVTLTVSAVYTYTPFTPVIGDLLGNGGMRMVSQSSMIVECQQCQ
jgi:Flp pilus assembly protein TadG